MSVAARALGLLVLAGALSACGQPPVLRGRVLDHKGTPVKGAEISTDPPTDTAQTSGWGFFAISRRLTDEGDPLPIEPGAYTLHVRGFGFADAEVLVELDSGVVVLPPVQLAPDPLNPTPANEDMDETAFPPGGGCL